MSGSPELKRAEDAVERGVTDVAPWITRAARVGEAAFGLVFAVIGLLALKAATGTGGEITDPKGALGAIRESAIGTAALVIVAGGMLAFALWSVLGALFDADRQGRSAKARLERLGHALRGVAYAVLGSVAVQQLRRPQRGGGHQEAQWTARVLDARFGRVAVGGIALLILVYALYQLKWALTAEVRKRLETAHDSPTTSALVWLGRFGNLALGVIVGMIAVFLLIAAIRHAPGEAAGVDESLARIAIGPFGRALLIVVGAGFIAFGMYEAASAWYRRMPMTRSS